MREIDKKWAKDCDYVICKICKKKFRAITNTHLKFHKLTQKEYREKYPFEQQHSMYTLKKISENGKLNVSHFMKIRRIQTIEEQKNRIMASKKSICLIKKEPTLKGFYKRTPEMIAKSKIAMKKRVLNGTWYNPSSSKQARIKISNSRKNFEIVRNTKSGKILRVVKIYSQTQPKEKLQ